MAKDVTPADRERMNTLLSDMGALRRVMKLAHDSHTAQYLNHLHDEAKREYDGLATRAREATQERMARVRAGKARKGDREGGEANA